MDAKQKVEVAARYAAWERTVWHAGNEGWLPVNTVKADSKIQAEAQARTFTKRETHLSSDAVAIMENADIDPLLNYHYGESGRYEPILRIRPGALGEYVSATTVKHEAPGLAGELTEAVSTLRMFSASDQFDIDTEGAHTATVSVGLLNPRQAEFAGVDLTLERSVTLVTDNWNAGGPDHTHRRIEGLMPTEILGEFFDIIENLPSIPGPLGMLDRLTFNHIDVDQVPEQYLETYR